MPTPEKIEFVKRENSRRPKHIPKDLYPVIDMIAAMLKPGRTLWCHHENETDQSIKGEYWSEIASDDVDIICTLLMQKISRGYSSYSVTGYHGTREMFRDVQEAILTPGYEPPEKLDARQLLILGAGIATIRNQLKKVAGPESDLAGQATGPAL